MKKLATFVFAMLLAGTLSFAQATPRSHASKPASSDSGKKAHKGGKKGHKGGKKSKNGSGGTSTAAPK